jgi:methionine-rich copper-binding protein CopC
MEVPIYIFGSDGKLVHTESAKPVNKKLEHVINLGNKLASGVYRIKVQISGKMHTTSVSIQ